MTFKCPKRWLKLPQDLILRTTPHKVHIYPYCVRLNLSQFWYYWYKMVSNLNLHLKLLFGSFCKITPVSQYEGVWLRIPLMHWACCWPNNIGYLIVYPIGCSKECFPLSVWLTVHSESPAIQDIPPPLWSFACVFCVFAAGLTKCWGRLWRRVLTEYLLCVTTRQFTNKIPENSNVWIHCSCMDFLCPVSQIRIRQYYLGLSENLTNLY